MGNTGLVVILLAVRFDGIAPLNTDSRYSHVIKMGLFRFTRKEQVEFLDPFRFSFDELRLEPRVSLDPVALKAAEHIEKLTAATKVLENSFRLDKVNNCIELMNRGWRDYFVAYGEHPAMHRLGGQFAAIIRRIDMAIDANYPDYENERGQKEKIDQNRAIVGFYRDALKVLTEQGVLAVEEAILRDTRYR